MRSVWRDQIRHGVTTRVATDLREQHCLETFLQLFDTLDRPFDEAASPVHVTASALVVGPRGVVLHLHKRLGIWLQPGGHIDADESPWDAARRETAEETGLDAQHPDSGPELIHVDVHPGARDHTHLDLRYLLIAPDVEPCPPPGESQSVRWFGWDEALAVADVGLRGPLVALSQRFAPHE